MRTVLEIGGGTTPYFLRYDIPWVSGEAYICLDVNQKRILESKSAIADLARRGEPFPTEGQFLVHDAITLPFEDSSMHEVVFSNVLTAPIHNNWNEKGTHVRINNRSGVIERPIYGTPTDGDRFYRERKPLVKEALRVLKPGGVLTIYTDLLVYGQHSFEKLLEELKRDMSLVTKIDMEEQQRIDEWNKVKLARGGQCYCFDAEVLPKSSVLRFTKMY